jgi:hypothetical protein
MKKLTKVGKKRLINKMILDEFMSVNSKYFHEIQKFPHFRGDGVIYKKGQHGETFYYPVSYDIDKKKIYNNHYVSLGGSIQIEVCNERTSNVYGYTCKDYDFIHINLCREFEFQKSFFGGKTGTDKQYLFYDVSNVINNKYNDSLKGKKYSVPLNPIIDPVDKKLFDEIKKIRLIRTKIRKNFDKIYKKQEQKIINDKVSIELKKLDKDNNGVVDIIQDDCFGELLQKHQSKIIKIDRKYIQDFVKISKFLKIKENNIQNSFKSLKKVKNISDFKKFIKIISNQKHGYELVLFHSLSMITSLVKDDLITFYEIYEEFDSLEVFKSNHENSISHELKTLNLKSSIMIKQLDGVMYSINSFENSVVNGLSNLSYVTRSGFDSLSSSIGSELKSINSSIRFNNLLTGIQTYQMYKINKNTRSLRS